CALPVYLVKDNDDIIFHLVGDCPLKESVEKLVLENGLSEKVKFYGFVKNALPLIANADVLVLPSIIEGLPGVLLEAMYCKTPVIAYNVGGISEILNSQTGIIVEKDNEAEFSAAILKVLRNSNDHSITAAYKLVSQNYMNEKLEDAFSKLYMDVI